MRATARVSPRFVTVVLLTTVLGVSGVISIGASGRPERVGAARLVLATTTSTENSGLLGALLPPFEERNNVVVDVIAVGTGQALQIGRSGDADVVMVHAPDLERRFVADGYGLERVYFMYNDFVLLGPADDPADASSASDAAGAFARIAQAEAPFISRGDNSGTHVKELEIWNTALGRAAEGSWYREIGQGMGAVITLANEQQAYTVADRGTYLSYIGAVNLPILLEGDPVLFNPYGVIAVDPERHPHVNVELAKALIDHLTSAEGRRIIREYRVQGEQLFFPDRD
ncbi:MAG: tungsten ABC transporter substrate-binding protein [Spirochaetaceae bacterium]|nr:MAG: tungsten ABC transporter substrate-binding protein [Spirochaetaceae bacterium]